jgi:hypothetical protein
MTIMFNKSILTYYIYENNVVEKHQPESSGSRGGLVMLLEWGGLPPAPGKALLYFPLSADEA